jgi:hypothetical protein
LLVLLLYLCSGLGSGLLLNGGVRPALHSPSLGAIGLRLRVRQSLRHQRFAPTIALPAAGTSCRVANAETSHQPTRSGLSCFGDRESSIDMHHHVLGARGLIVSSTALVQRGTLDHDDGALGR